MRKNLPGSGTDSVEAEVSVGEESSEQKLSLWQSPRAQRKPVRPQTKTEKKEDNTMETMNVKDFYFDLPQELIAQDPLEDRSSSRLLVLDKNTGEMEHRHFRDITEYLRPGDCLVINNTKVIPARLFGVKEDTQAKIEVLLLKRRENDIWETLVKPGKNAGRVQ